MKTIDEQLADAATETHSQIATMERSSSRTIRRRHRSQRVLSGVGAFALVLAAFGVTSLIVADEPSVAPGAGSDTPTTTTAVTGEPDAASQVETVTTLAPTEPITVQESTPHLGITLDGWVPVHALDDGHSASGVYYSDEASIEAGVDGAGVAIEVWSDVPGTEQGSGFEHAVEALAIQGGESLPEVAVTDDWTATAFTFTDPTTGHGGFAFVWRLAPTVSVEVLAYVETYAQATQIVQSVQPLSDFEWNEILDNVGDATYDTATTTTIVEETDG